MVLTIKLGLKPPSEGAKRRKPDFTRRIASSESDSNDSIPDALSNQPSTSRTPIDKPKNEKTRIGRTQNGDIKKKSFVRPEVSAELSGFGSQRAIKALTGVTNGFVYQLKNKSDSAAEDDAGSDTSKEKDCNDSNGSLVDSSLNEEIPEGTVIVQPEAAPDGEDDWYKSKEFKKQFTRERRERKEVTNQSAPSSVESVFCTACNAQVNPFDRRTFFCHPVLSVVICKSCMEFYDSGPWKLDEDGIEEECRWCGEGGSLSCCDFCCKTFCKRCIIRNLGRGEHNRIQTQKKWKCYVCEPSPLKELVAKCSALINQPVKIEKKEKEKVKVNPPKKVVKELKKERKSFKMQDAAIAEEFLQYLVGNISNRALFMKSLVRLKKEVPNMQKLQMDLSLKHVGEVKSVLKELEACVQRKLYGDIHKSDSALDGTDPEDFDSPERKSKVQPESAVSTPEPKNEEAGENETHEMESAMDVPMDTSMADGVEEANVLREKPSLHDASGSGNVPDAMDTNDAEVNQSSETGEEHIQNNEEIRENSSQEDADMEGNLGDDEANDNDDDTNDIELGDVSKETELEDNKQIDTGAKMNEKPLPINIKQEAISDDETNVDTPEETGNNEEAECLSSQHSARKVKVTTRSPRSRSESQGASPRASQEDTEAKLMSMIDESDDDSSDESEGSDYTPKKSSKSKKSPGKAKKELSKKFSKLAKKDPGSDADSDHEDTTKKREGPGMDSSNPEEESGFDGIPGESSTEASQDEGGEKKENVEKSKKLSTSKQSSESSEEASSEEENISEQSDKNDKTWGSKNAKKRSTRLSRKKKSESTERDSASEEEMELKRLEGIGGLKRKHNRNHGTDSDDASKSEHDDKDVPEDNIEDNEKRQDLEKTAEEESEPEENPKKAKKPRKSPAKLDPKSREYLSSDSSSDDESADDESDENSGLKWKSLNGSSKKKKKDSPEKVPETLLMEELEGDDEDEDDDDDDDEDEDDDEEVDGAGSKRSKRKAQKKTEEEEPEDKDEDWDNGAGKSRHNGTGGSGDGKKGGDDKGKKRKGKKETDDEDEEEENPEENGEEEEENEDDEEKDSDDEVGTKKCHPLLRVNISDSSDEEEEDTSEKKSKKGKAAPKKKGKATKKKRRKEIDTDDYFTSSESDDLSDERPKRKRVTRSQTATSTEDSATELKKPRKRAKKQERNTSSEADSSKETKKPSRGKGKKRRRIKVASESDSENETQTQEDESQEDKKGSGDSDGDNDSPRKGRKQIRRVLKKSKLQAETLAAEEEEKERRKRIEEKRKEIITEEDEKAEKSAVVKSCILEKEKDSDEIVLEVDQRIVEHLKPHQAEGIQFMFDSTFESIKKAEEKGGGCILAHCMGLGKTLQVISYLHTVMTCDDLNVKTCLVVAPLNTVLNWEAEFEKWTGHMDTGINVYEMSSVKNNASRASYLDHWHKKGGVMILGYAMYRNLSLLTHIRKKKEKAIFLKTLVDPGPDIVVCDEGHMLKNERSSISKAMNSINTRRRICLTGTPLQNNLIEYHCMVHFVKPNLLGTLREFKNRFVNPITNGQHSDSTARDVKIMKRRAHVLHNLLSGCVQRKDYTALTKFLPPKHEFVISIRLSEVQIKLYEHYLNTLSGRKDDGTKTQCTSLFSDYQALMNVWTHPRLLKLASEREDRNAARREMNDFVTSDEEDGDESDESMKAFVISSDSELEDPWKSSSKKKKEKDEKPSTSNSSRPTRQTRRGRAKNDDSDEEISLAGSSSDNNDGNNSDSSVEVVKSWNTRSRAKESGLSEGASTSAADFYIPPSPEKVNKWYSEFFSEEDSYKIELSGKLVLLFEILKMAESVGEKVLVFSQSLLSLDMIEDMLAHLDEKAQEERVNGEQDLENQIGGTGSWIKGEDYFRMDGSTAAHLRRRWSEIFNDLDNLRSRLFLISTRAGSLGTNLIAANRVIIFDANWNPSHDIQSIFRVYRFGQERATFIYRFIAQGTMEEKIYDRQVIKQSLSQRVVDEHQIERHFTSADLSELYNFVPDRLDDPNRPERPTPVLPKDFFLAELLKTQMKWIVKYHEHDSLLENQMEEELTEEERKQAWNDYDREKNQSYSMPTMSRQLNPMDMENIYREGESILRMGEMMLNYPGQANQYMMGNNIGHPSLAMGGPGVSGGQNNMQRLLELQSMYRAQQMQHQRQQQLQQQQQQRLRMLQQAQAAAGQQSDHSGSTSLRQLQQIAMMQQHQQQQRLLQEQQQRMMKQRQPQQNASSSQGKAP